MDVYHQLHGTTFVWDARKASANAVKHDGIAFEHAITVFFDPFLRVVDASRESESRQAVIGFDAYARMLFVVHVEVADECIRIISARRATRQERDYYDS
jgi:uncharacterized protein